MTDPTEVPAVSSRRPVRIGAALVFGTAVSLPLAASAAAAPMACGCGAPSAAPPTPATADVPSPGDVRMIEQENAAKAKAPAPPARQPDPPPPPAPSPGDVRMIEQENEAKAPPPPPAHRPDPPSPGDVRMIEQENARKAPPPAAKPDVPSPGDVRMIEQENARENPPIPSEPSPAATPDVPSPGDVRMIESEHERQETSAEDTQARIDELADEIDDIEFDYSDPSSPPIGSVRLYDNKQMELQDERARLALQGSGHCDDDCDVDAPFTNDGKVDDPLEQAALTAGPRPTREQVVREADRIAIENQERQRREAEAAAKEQPPAEEESNPVKDILEWVPGVGTVISGYDCVTADSFEEAAWACAGAIPGAGYGAKGAKAGRKLLDAADEASDAGKHLPPPRVRPDGTPEGATNAFVDRVKRERERAGLDPDVLDESPESRAAFEGIFGRTMSGTRGNASVPGMVNLNHTRGHSSELRTVMDLAADPKVAKITAVPSAKGGRTPDFVVTPKQGQPYRVEVTTVTGGGRGRQPRGTGQARQATQQDVASAIDRKTRGNNQFQADVAGVPKGGRLDIHVRGPDPTKAADDAVAAGSQKLSDAGVDTVQVTTGEGRRLTYTKGADGVYRRPS